MTLKRALSLLVVLAVVGIVVKMIRGRSIASSAPDDQVDEWGKGSFPASDPPAHW